MEEIEQFVRKKGLSAQFLQIPEAREYRQSVAMRQQATEVQPEGEKTFPEDVFGTI